VDLVLERHRDRHRRKGIVVLTGEAEDRPDPARPHGRNHNYVVSDLRDPRGDLAREATEIKVWPHHVLDRKSKVDQVPVTPDIDVLQIFEDGLPLIPGHVLAVVDNVLTLQRTDRDEPEIRDPEA